MKKNKYISAGFLAVVVTSILCFLQINNRKVSHFYIGQKIDSLNGVYVHYNGSVSNISGRNYSSKGYNLGLKYQCVEFVKRYYYEHLQHQMPNTYGNAKDFYDKNISDGAMNSKRDLTQYSNSSLTKPKNDDLLIFDGTRFNKFGHVAIVSKVADTWLEITQQNPGPNSNSRVILKLSHDYGKWRIENDKVLGWLRKNK